MSEIDLLKQLNEARELVQSSTDPQLRQLAQEEMIRLEKEIASNDPVNKRDVIMEIRAGTGGDEAELFAGELLRMYSRFAERNGWRFQIIDSNQSDLGGVRSVTIEISGRPADSLGVYQSLKYEGGIHRVQRIPKTEKSGRQHTSAASVVVLPKAEEVDVAIKPEDIRIDVYRSSGHGGQSVNTTDSAVRITHLPTGLIVTCQDEKSQLKNKIKALSVLRSRLMAQEKEKQSGETGQLRRSMVGSGDRSEKIRTYNFPQDRITDHRITKSWHKIERILDGELNPIIESLADFEAKEISRVS